MSVHEVGCSDLIFLGVAIKMKIIPFCVFFVSKHSNFNSNLQQSTFHEIRTQNYLQASLQSAINVFESPVHIITTDITHIPSNKHTRLFRYAIDNSISSWVTSYNLLRMKYLFESHCSLCFYFEIDMIFRPGVSNVLKKYFTNTFDVAYTYRGRRECFGSMNTGTILYKNTNASHAWLQKNYNALVLKVKYHQKKNLNVCGRKKSISDSFGGIDQTIVDDLGFDNIPFLTSKKDVDTGVTIFSLPRNLINSAKDCCDISAFAYHFNGGLENKNKMFSKCCKALLPLH